MVLGDSGATEMTEVIAVMFFGFVLIGLEAIVPGEHSWSPWFCLHCFLRIFGPRGIRRLVCSLGHLPSWIARCDPDGFS